MHRQRPQTDAITRRPLSRRSGLRWLAPAMASLSIATLAPACSQGEGSGSVLGTLDVTDCWTGPFNLNPDFFAAVPYRNGLQIRIQSGSDYEGFSDGVSLLIYDSTKIRPDENSRFAGQYGAPLTVDLPPEVTPPGTPVVANADPANVSMTLYLQRSCRTQNVTLHVVKEVSLSDGTCDAPATKGADPRTGCDAATESPAGAGDGKSVASFTHIYSGNVEETNASDRLIEGCFDVYLADPREAAPGGLGPPPPCRGHLRGNFSFFFDRGRPAQPFP